MIFENANFETAKLCEEHSEKFIEQFKQGMFDASNGISFANGNHVPYCMGFSFVSKIIGTPEEIIECQKLTGIVW